MLCLLSKTTKLFQWLYWLVWLSFISTFWFEHGNVSENIRLFNLVLIGRFVDTEEQTSMRHCSLIWCPLLFWMTCILLHAAWSQGDPRKVIYPTDSRGQFCGQAGTPLEWVTLTIWAWCLQYMCPWKSLTFRLLTLTYNTKQIIGLFYCFSRNRKKRLLFYFNILKCASPLVLLEFQCPTTQVRNRIYLSFMCIATFHISKITLTDMIVCCCLCAVMCGKLSWQAPYTGESQVRQQRRPWILQAIL